MDVHPGSSQHPARNSSQLSPSFTEHGGSRLLTLAIAGIRIAITSADDDMNLCLDGDLLRFAAPGGDADVSLRVCWRDLEDFDCGKVVFDSGGAWQFCSQGDDSFVRCLSPRFGSVPFQIGRFDRDFTRGDLFLHRPFFEGHATVNPMLYPLDEVLMLHLLSRGRGVEVHACGVADATGNGYVFSGHSGAGKTTMAKLWAQEPGSVILSDDRVILRFQDGQYWMHGTPWHGEAEFAEPMRAPLKRLFFLRHGAENSLLQKSGAEAVAMLFARTFPTFHDPEGLAFTLDFYRDLTEQIPCSELGVVPNRGILDFLRCQCA